MISRNAVRMAACAVALGSLSVLSLRGNAQGAPFTIRRPPDGATVREKVKVEIPRASIGEKDFVVIYLDGKFDVALDPQRMEDSAVSGSMAASDKKNNESRFFTFVWDTKAEGVSDGQHSVRVVLFEPAEGGTSISVTQRATSEVKINVANKITDGPATLRLRYKYPEGKDLHYLRSGKSVRAGGGTLTAINTDQEIGAVNSKLLLGIMSNEGYLSLVRNKLTSLAVLAGGQEQVYPDSQLSKSMYQELDTQGNVHYETGGSISRLAMESEGGVPIENTLELPVLPSAPVAIGQTWTTPEQRFDIPGLPGVLQPRIRLQNKLVDLEWEGNYRTAKIHQHADDVKLPGEFSFGSIPLTSATASYDRDVYIAYTSGTLVRMTRTLTIKGRTTAQSPDASSSSGSYGGGLLGGAGMSGGMMGGSGRPPGVPGSYGMSGGKGQGGGPLMSGGASMGGARPGMSSGPGMGAPGMMGSSGMGGARPGMSSGPGMGGPGLMGPNSGYNPGGGSGFGSGFGSGLSGQPDYPVTLKTITTTELLKITTS